MAYKLPEKSFPIDNNLTKEHIKIIVNTDTTIYIRGLRPGGGLTEARVRIITFIQDEKDKDLYHGRLFMGKSCNFGPDEYRVYKYNFREQKGEVFERGKVYEEIFVVLPEPS